ncbi:hypothetical protein ACFL4A_00380 [bacterium]
MKKIRMILTVLIVVSMFSNVFARGFIGHDNIEKNPTVLNYAGKGFNIGLILGLAGGYLAYKDTDGTSDDKKILLKGPAYGALIGTFVGLGIGIYDLSRPETGMGSIILQDVRSGAYLGTALGACLGLIKMIDTEKGEDIVIGAAWGSIIGAVAGLLIGIYEGPKVVRKYAYNPNTPPIFWVKTTEKNRPIFGMNFVRATF